jgi:hypothetical protein
MFRSISDHGGSIAPSAAEDLRSLFSTKSRGNVSMGLGLTICHAIVRARGAIGVVSEMTVGTTVHHAPCFEEAPAAERPSEAQTEERSGGSKLGGRAELGRLLEATIRRMGAGDIVADGQSAVDAYGRAMELGRPFAVVILNLTVRAGLGGKEAMRELLKLDPAVKGIITKGTPRSGHARTRSPRIQGRSRETLR